MVEVILLDLLRIKTCSDGLAQNIGLIRGPHLSLSGRCDINLIFNEISRFCVQNVRFRYYAVRILRQQCGFVVPEGALRSNDFVFLEDVRRTHTLSET